MVARRLSEQKHNLITRLKELADPSRKHKTEFDEVSDIDEVKNLEYRFTEMEIADDKKKLKDAGESHQHLLLERFVLAVRHGKTPDQEILEYIADSFENLDTQLPNKELGSEFKLRFKIPPNNHRPKNTEPSAPEMEILQLKFDGKNTRQIADIIYKDVQYIKRTIKKWPRYLESKIEIVKHKEDLREGFKQYEKITRP